MGMATTLLHAPCDDGPKDMQLLTASMSSIVSYKMLMSIRFLACHSAGAMYTCSP